LPSFRDRPTDDGDTDDPPVESKSNRESMPWDRRMMPM
jgi:hypothetical protein